jgi:beta-aspartyl-peptidase (threonine type)
MKAPLAVIALCLLGCSRRFAPADRQSLQALIDNQQDAWNRGDLAGYMDGYARTPQLVFTSGNRIRRGWDETMAAYQKRYGGNSAGMGHLAMDVIEVQPVGSDGAVLLGRWRLTETPQAGGGVFSVVAERRPEGWRIVHDHTSSE